LDDAIGGGLDDYVGGSNRVDAMAKAIDVARLVNGDLVMMKRIHHPHGTESPSETVGQNYMPWWPMQSLLPGLYDSSNDHTLGARRDIPNVNSVRLREVLQGVDDPHAPMIGLGPDDRWFHSVGRVAVGNQYLLYSVKLDMVSLKASNVRALKGNAVVGSDRRSERKNRRVQEGSSEGNEPCAHHFDPPSGEARFSLSIIASAR